MAKRKSMDAHIWASLLGIKLDQKDVAVMKPSYKESLHFRRTAYGVLKIIDRVAATDFPWTDRNVRMYQSVWCNCEQNRVRNVKLYLNLRKSRKS